MTKTKSKPQKTEPDSTYFLKIVLYVILGSLWLRFNEPLQIGDLVLHAFPIGLVFGLLFASHDHFAVDRKIEFAILLIVAIVTFFLPAAIII